MPQLPVVDVTGTAAQPVLIKSAKQKPLGLIRRLARERKGSVAIEFAIMAVPFLTLIFAIFESCMSFATQQLMANAADRIARDVRTGRLKAADVSGGKLHTLMCDGIALMAPDGCPDLIIDLKTYTNFAAVPKKVPFTGTGDIDNSGFTATPGGPSTINHMRVYYRWPIWTDFLKKTVSNLPGNKTLLLTSATWRNEPFDL